MTDVSAAPLDERIEQVIDGLLDGTGPLWATVAERFPEITTGDDPGRDERLIDALRQSIRDWIDANQPSAEERAVKVLQGAGYEATLIHTGGGCMVCEVELPDEVGKIWISDAADVFGDDANRYAFGVYEYEDEDEGAVERVADDAGLLLRVAEQHRIERRVTQYAGTNRSPVYRRRYLGQRAEHYVVKHPDGDPSKRISVRRWLDSGEHGRTGDMEIVALTGELSRHDDRRAGSFADVDVCFRAKIEHPTVELVRRSLVDAGQSFRAPEPPEDRYWLTDAQWRVLEHRLNAVAENCADGGGFVESFEIRPATADDRYSMITVGEIVHNVVVTGWSEGKSYTTIEAIGQSGESYGRQDEAS